MKRISVLSLVLIFVMLTGCFADATQPPVVPPVTPPTSAPATQAPEPTKVPPTATPVPPTATPVPPTKTNTPVPPTATPIPPTATPEPDLAAVIGAAGYISTTPVLAKGFKIGDLLEISLSEAYKKGADQFIYLITFPLPGQAEQVGFGTELQNPNFVLAAVVAALKGVGMEGRADLAGSAIAEISKGVSFTTTVSGSKQRVDVMLFRRGNTGAIVFVVRPDGTAAAIDLNLVAQKLDKKIASGK